MMDDTTDDAAQDAHREAGSESRTQQEALDDRINDGGGCMEAWRAATSIRDGDDQQEEPVSEGRRRVLKSALAGMTVPGFARVADADRDAVRASAEQVIDDPARARSIVRESGSDVLAKLSDRDIVDTPSVDEFGIEQVVSFERYALQDNGVAATVDAGFVNGEPVPELETGLRTDSHDIVLRVDLDTGRSYARLTPLDGDGGTEIVADHDEPNIDCRWKTSCYNWGCPWYQKQIQKYCCYTDPETGNYRCDFHERYCTNGFCF